MISSKKMAGRAILLAGPPGTGKVVSVCLSVLHIVSFSLLHIMVTLVLGSCDGKLFLYRVDINSYACGYNLLLSK